jgi:phosphoglycolate phosphatase
LGNTDIVGDVRRLIVFDLDGTLIDSRRDLADAANALITERGGSQLPEETIGRMVGDGAAALIRRALTAAAVPLDESSLPRFLELYDARMLRTTRPYAGITEALEAVRQYGVLAVLTNKPLAATQQLLTAFDLARFFSTVIGGDGPFARKPDPQGLQRLMVEHGVPAETTIMVGDSRIDAATAHSAGARFCWARYGFGAVDVTPAPAVSAERPADLPAAIVALLE